ncbi:hypothetical protein [uncultured Aquimarina sp.]|uniref:hypothetical protein n=1 Tax=uncultured Aquimarina sp. TaxID=575652 RepID=UPI0026240502|nr:hypothetical protein [uncultured Aquimarina sp.]
MEIDHIFIFSKNNGKEADDLVSFDFVEGSSRIHRGQGTTNRKFYFENFFLEILWVIDEKEIQNETTAQTTLWERSQFKENGYSPYGLCLLNCDLTDTLFEESKIYQPDYFPKGMSIDIITNEKRPQLPWTFRLPYRGEKKVNDEPIEHSNGIKFLTRIEFEVNDKICKGHFTDYFTGFDHIAFKESKRTHLNLEFDNKTQGKKKEFPELGLTINY